MNQAISGAGLFLVQAIVTLGTFAFLLRFVLQAVRADFYNPITQAIVRLTDPLLKPARKIVPPIGGLDVASLLIAVLFQFALIFLLFSGASSRRVSSTRSWKPPICIGVVFSGQ